MTGPSKPLRAEGLQGWSELHVLPRVPARQIGAVVPYGEQESLHELLRGVGKGTGVDRARVLQQARAAADGAQAVACHAPAASA